MRKRSVVGAAIAVALAIALPGATLAAGFSNGSFETGTNSPGSYETLYAGSTVLAPWSVGSSSIDWVGNLWQAEDGSNSIDLNGLASGGVAATGSISQTFDTTFGYTYVVQFWLSGNFYGGPTVKTLTVSATGAPASSYSYDMSIYNPTASNMNWQDQAYSFVASGSSTTLTFASTTTALDGGSVPGSFGPVLDNVSITQTANTGASCKKGGWATMKDNLGNFFKNQGDCVSFYATGGVVPIGS